MRLKSRQPAWRPRLPFATHHVRPKEGLKAGAPPCHLAARTDRRRRMRQREAALRQARHERKRARFNLEERDAGDLTGDVDVSEAGISSNRRPLRHSTTRTRNVAINARTDRAVCPSNALRQTAVANKRIIGDGDLLCKIIASTAGNHSSADHGARRTIRRLNRDGKRQKYPVDHVRPASP